MQFELQRRRSSTLDLEPDRELVQSLWHGTQGDVVEQITNNNFNRSFAGINGMCNFQSLMTL